MKLIVILILGIIILSLFIIYYHENNKDVKMEELKYQGPVPEGYDEEHFRNTGETKPLEIKE